MPTPPTDDLMGVQGKKGRHGGTAPTKNETALRASPTTETALRKPNILGNISGKISTEVDSIALSTQINLDNT